MTSYLKNLLTAAQTSTACFSHDWPNQKLNRSNLLDDNVTSNSIIRYKFVFQLGSALDFAWRNDDFWTGNLLSYLTPSERFKWVKRNQTMQTTCLQFSGYCSTNNTDTHQYPDCITNFDIALYDKNIHRKWLQDRWYRWFNGIFHRINPLVEFKAPHTYEMIP